MGNLILWKFMLFLLMLLRIDCKGCNKNIRTTKMVRSPHVTSLNRGKPIACHFRFFKYSSDTDKIFEINFRSFQVGTPLNGSECIGGHVQLIDSGLRNLTSGLICGNIRSSRTYLSDAESVTLVFRVENYTRRFHFRAQSSVLPKLLALERHKEMDPNNGNFIPVPGTYCDRKYVNCSTSGCRVTSPGYPGFYARNLTCKYRLESNATQYGRVRLAIGGQYHDTFDVWTGSSRARCRSCSEPMTSECPHDYVDIWEETMEGVRMKIGRFCGRGDLPRIVSRGGDVILEFVTSRAGSIENDGFNLHVVPERKLRHQFDELAGSVMVKNECSWVFVGKQGHFTSLRHWYPHGTSCKYRFLGPTPKHRVWIHFTSFYAPRDGTCDDWITIGGSEKFCGRKAPNETWLSDSSSFEINFNSTFGSFDGLQFEFSAFYMFVETSTSGSPVPGSSCDEIFASNVTSKGSFEFLKNRLRLRDGVLRCKFTFSGLPTEQVRVVFTNMSFDSNRQSQCIGAAKRGCWDSNRLLDRILVFDGLSRVQCLCAPGFLPLEFVSTTSELRFELHLNGIHATSYRDSDLYLFKGRFEFLQLGCGKNELKGRQGMLVYPSVPQRSGEPVLCKWTIEVARNCSVFLKIQHLSLPGKNCTESRLRAYLYGRSEPYLEMCPGSKRSEALPVGWDNIKALPRLPNRLLLELASPSSTHASFKIIWSEVSYAYRYSAQRIVDNEACEYRCPDRRTCLSRHLLCDGVIDCPQTNFSGHPLDEAYTECPQVDWLVFWLFLSIAVSFTVVLAVCLVLVGLWKWKKHSLGVPK